MKRILTKTLLLIGILSASGLSPLAGTAVAAGSPAPTILSPRYGATVPTTVTLRWTQVAPRHAYKIYDAFTGQIVKQSPPGGIIGHQVTLQLPRHKYWVFMCRGITPGTDKWSAVWEFNTAR